MADRRTRRSPTWTMVREAELRQAALAALASDLAGALEPQAVLERAVDAASELLNAHTVAAFLRRGDGRGFDAPASRGLEPLEPCAPALGWENTVAGRAVRAGAVQDIADAAVERAAGTVFPRLAGDVPVGAILVAPIAEGNGEPLGVLEVYTAERRDWSAADRDLLRALAAACAVALRGAREMERARRDAVQAAMDARRLAVLNRVAESVIGAPSFGAICDRTLVALGEALDVSGSAIHVYDEAAPPERVLRMVARLGLGDEAAAAWETASLEQGIVGLAAARRAMVLVNSIDQTPPEAVGTLEMVRASSFQARAGVPLVVRGRLLGVLTLAFHDRRDWTGADRVLLQTVANQLASALEAERLRAAAAAAAAAREADRLKSELLATVSHELRTPLGAIKGFASSLLHHGERLPATERAEAARLIDEAADRLAELVDNLLDLQRIEAGALPVARDLLDLAPLVRDVVAEMVPHAPRHTLCLDTPPRLPLIHGDPRRIRQVLHNLLDNALKYSPDGGPIGVQLRPRRGHVELRVVDAGLGLAPDQLERIFERFHRVDTSSTRRIGGTGLGLAIARGLVEAHGGYIRAESPGEGYGATFIAGFPRAAKERGDKGLVTDRPGTAGFQSAPLESPGTVGVQPVPGRPPGSAGRRRSE